MSRARGRPSKKEVNKVDIKSITLEYLSTKENNYGSMICYFKMLDKDCKAKMKPIVALEAEDIRMPHWRTDKNQIIKKMKDKCVPNKDLMEAGSMYLCDALMESYCINKDPDPPKKCYYCKLTSMRGVGEYSE